jgi:hypothetical protein
MTFGMKTAVLALALSFTALSGGVAAAKDQLLGVANFEARPQRDVINVNAREGAFRAMRFEVRQNDVEILDLRIVYGNGEPEDIRVRQVFRAGSSSRQIDLQGRKRAIRQIIVTYVARGPAKIAFFGIEGSGGGNANWDRLGCKDVGFGIDRDTLRIGRKDGPFRAIRLRVRHAPIEIFDLRVVFGNGTAQNVRVRQVIPPGGETRAIDLAGNIRGIDRVELLYRSIPTFKGKAEVCIDGLQR